MQVRVWWEASAPPHEEEGAAFYPARVVRNIIADDGEAAFVLEFATGECNVSAESVFPLPDNPVSFGGETEPIQVGPRSSTLLAFVSIPALLSRCAWIHRVTTCAGPSSLDACVCPVHEGSRAYIGCFYGGTVDRIKS